MEGAVKSAIRSLLATAMLATALAGTASASPATETTYYVSVGDSMAAGFQPNGRFTRGYADQLYREVRGEIPGLRLNKLGCPGETIDTMVNGGICQYPAGSQLKEAVAFLNAHQGQIQFITIDIGGNDWLDACFDGVLIDVDCTRGILPDLTAGIRFILGRLQAAAPGVPIAGMTYHDPFLGFWVLAPVHGPDIARQDQEADAVLDAGLADAYKKSGAVVADIARPGFFDTANFTDMVWTPKWGEIPVNVANACTLTWFCSVDFRGDVHPNTSGYGLIAEAFEEALGL
jgi:lysophospholipase L1-like esterase